ncbi:MAG: Asp-tRNA(Asn)/Glu-tRNA(Gln) amidotransferase subunit GatA [Chloroflexota bacterium]|nr:Asp-tRNA(Asn)/Glu-tRNA(Gln) amidotransferase subunit GatA [Chloroflexota bacterium]
MTSHFTDSFTAPTDALTDLTLTEARARLDDRSLSAVDLVRACLDRIATTDATLHAFLTVTGERALTQAADADRALDAGERRPLLGIPLAVKDILSTQGVETTCGSLILKGYVPVYTATSVRRLEDAGAIVIGKTNLDEFAMGSSTENSAYGASRNPWDTARVPGGSSGGSAVAVAARQALGAIGTDTGGSIRLPAAYCGVVGLKPSYGRVSRYGLIAFGSSLDCPGPMARTVEDTARLFDVMAGHDPLDSTSVAAPAPDSTARLRDGIAGLRVGVPRQYFVDGMQPEVERVIKAAIERMRDLGAHIVEIDLPHTDEALAVYYIIAPAEASANLARFDGIRFGARTPRGDLWTTTKATRGEGFGAEVKRRIMLGTYALSAGYYDAYYGKAQQVRTLIKDDFDQAFTQVDVIAAPVAPTTAFRFGENVDDPIRMYLQDVFTIPASLAGVCGLSLPCGMDDAGMPIGLQLIGAAFQEATLLRAAYAYEQS